MVKHCKKFLLIALFYPILSVHLYAQVGNIVFERFSIEDGLSNPNVMQVIQDHEGFLWIATRHGLNKYDGYEFTTFEHIPGQQNSLSHNDITTLYEDSEGTLWVGTWLSGLNRFDRYTETFEHFQHDPDDSTTISHNDVRFIYEDRDRMLWVGTRGGGLNFFDREMGVFHHFKANSENPGSLSSNFV